MSQRCRRVEPCQALADRPPCVPRTCHRWLLSADVPDKVLAKTLVGLRTMMKRTVRVVQSVMRMKRLSKARLFAGGVSPFAQQQGESKGASVATRG